MQYQEREIISCEFQRFIIHLENLSTKAIIVFMIHAFNQSIYLSLIKKLNNNKFRYPSFFRENNFFFRYKKKTFIQLSSSKGKISKTICSSKI